MTKKRPVLVAALAVALMGATLALFIMSRPTKNGDPENGGNGTTSTNNEFESADEAWRLAQQANAMLENEFFVVDTDADGNNISGYEWSIDTYQRLAKAYPDERLPLANLAIARHLQFLGLNDNVPASEREEVQAAALASIDAWIAADDTTGIPYWLKAKTLMKAGSDQVTDEILQLLQTAAGKQPDELTFQTTLYKAADLAAKTGSIDEAKAKEIWSQALAVAYELKPGNLAISLDYALLLTEQQDPQLQQVLEGMAQDIAAVANHRILQGRRNDPTQIHTAALAAVAEENWRDARLQLTFLTNVSKGYLYSLAIDQSENYPLAFIDRQMSDGFQDDLSAASEEVDAVPVKLTAEALAIPNSGAVKQIVVGDVDLDNQPDLIVLSSTSLTAYRKGENDQQPFVEPIFQHEFAADAYTGFLMADLDRDDKKLSVFEQERNDTLSPEELAAANQNAETIFDKADVDFVLYGSGGFACLRNDFNEADRSRSLAVVEQPDESFTSLSGITAACLIDIDHDSDMDIVAASGEQLHILLHIGENRESLSYQYKEHSQFSELPAVTEPIHSLQAGDWDRDVDIDVLVVSETGSVFGVLSNQRHGRFRWQDLTKQFPQLQLRQQARWWEADGNISWDLLGLTETGWQTQLTETQGAQDVRPLDMNKGELSAKAEFLLADLDNDGGQDLVSWDTTQINVLRADLQGNFAASDSMTVEAQLEDVQVATAGDVDLDGDLDLVVATGGDLQLLRNEGGNANHWLSVRAIGTQDNAGRANFHGINSVLEINAGDRYQAQFVDSPKTHFGLGAAEQPDYVRFIWPNGMPQGLLVDQADKTVRQKMYLKGSCPFVYAWDGQEYVFVTDCLWAAPIGLQVAEGVAAPTRSWEYLKIPGELLRPIDGEYRLQLTEELWEAAYFDHVELICIDHPADVEIFSNEKVGPPTIADYQVHVVRKRRLPVSAVNQHGEDVIEWIRAEDDQFLRLYDERIQQGLTTPQVLELDLGEVESQEQLTLFLRGWIHPTDTSLNVAFSQNPSLDGPQPPSIWIIGEDGNWQPLERPMGFPGGKTKTIAVDLSDAFPTDDYRLQIRTTAEIYWDAVFYTTNDGSRGDSDAIKSQSLTPFAADLHYRGFSERHPRRPNHPETFDYQQVSTEPKWPPMLGRFTRYGDVIELLTEADDMMAILGAGDEMTVRFKVPSDPVRPGWKRDFMLHCVGYDKDADLNTIHGQSVEPLPHRNMTEYPYGVDNGYPDTPEHREYLRVYQTRRAAWARFWKPH